MPLKAAPFLQSAQNLSVISVRAKSLRLPRTESLQTVSFVRKKRAHCIFEYIYFARLDSTIDGINIYDARIRAGAALAAAYPVDADLVVGVPDSGIPAAKGYSEASGIPFGIVLLIKTAMWEERLLNRHKKNVNPVYA